MPLLVRTLTLQKALSNGPQRFISYFSSPTRAWLCSPCHCVWLLGFSASCQEGPHSFNDLANISGRLGHPMALGQGLRGVGRPMAMARCLPPWPLWALCVTKSQLSKVTPDKPPSFSGAWLPPS